VFAAITFASAPNLILLPLSCPRCGHTLDDDDLAFGCPECGWCAGDEYDPAQADEEEARAILNWLEGDAVYA
jgi:predicted  nucleic acid-binding Zn-ribbon protein